MEFGLYFWLVINVLEEHFYDLKFLISIFQVLNFIKNMS